CIIAAAKAVGMFLYRCGKAVIRWFRQDMGSKLLAILFAFVLWSYVLVTTNPVRDKHVTGLPVQVSNLELLHDRGLDVVEDIASGVTARVTIQANNDRLNDISADNVTVTAELSSITKEGVHRIELSAVTQYGTVHRISPSYIDVHVEERVTRAVEVEASLPEAPDDVWRAPENIYPAAVTVTGARSVVESVMHAQVEAPDDMQIEENVALTLPVSLVDEAGHLVDRNVQLDLESVVVTTHYYPTKSVPLQLASQIQPAAGYRIKETVLLRQYVVIAAPSVVLDDVDMVQTQFLIANDLTADVVLETAPQLPNGVVHALPQVIRVRVDVEEEQVSVTLGNMPVRAVYARGDDISDLAERVSIAPVSISLQGYRSSVSGVSHEDIELYADVTGLSDGQSAELKWRWVGKNPMPSDLEVTAVQTVAVHVSE
ncbi:MAG: hypothetical protein J6L88_03975, partial [Clostridia bacterium]|nr:hypothetical protein [Clostridia bacterium]